MTKVVWIPPGPNKNLNSPIWRSLGKKHPELDLVMVVTEDTRAQKQESKYYKLVYLQGKDYGRYLLFPWMLLNKLRGISNADIAFTIWMKGLGKTLHKEKPDVVISNLEYNFYTWQAAWYCYKTNTPFVIQTETQRVDGLLKKASFVFMKVFMRKLLFTQPRYVFAWTKLGKDYATKHFPVDKKKVLLVPAGIDTQLFHPVQVKKDWSVFHILMVARFAPYKHHHDLLRAVAYIRAHTKQQVHLSLLGSGPLEAQIKQQVTDLGLSDAVTFLPRTPFEELRSVYCAHDVLVLPSFNEAIGMVVPEAMACGVPVVVSDTAGASLYVSNAKNGYLFETGNVTDLAKKIMLLFDKRRHAQFSKHAQKHIQDEFTVEHVAELYARAVQSIAKP